MTTILQSPSLKRGSTRVAERPLRVCHVSLSLCTGGLERLLADFASHHDRERYVLSFVAMHQTGRFAEEIEAQGCRVSCLRQRGRWKQVRELARFFREGEFDVVHTHNIHPHIYGTVAARLAGIPVVVNTRHGQRTGHGWKARVGFRAASWMVDRVVAVSTDALKLCVQADGLSPHKVSRIWNGIDLEVFPWRGPAVEPVAISVARLSPEKDIATMLRAMALAVKQCPELRLKVVGDGPDRGMLEQLRNELSLESQVELLGERMDVAELLGQAGFFVSSSLSEGISLTLLEAMAAGLPVLATAVGGNPEVIEPQQTGCLVPAGNVERLSEGMVEMCRQSEQWKAMGLRGRQRVERLFDVRRMVADYEQLYDELAMSKGVIPSVPRN